MRRRREGNLRRGGCGVERDVQLIRAGARAGRGKSEGHAPNSAAAERLIAGVEHGAPEEPSPSAMLA